MSDEASRASTATATAGESDQAAQVKGTMSQEKRSFWSRDVKDARKKTALDMLKGLALITVILWIALPIFWGSNWLLLRYFNQLTIVAVDFESPQLGQNAAVGPVLTQMAQETNVQTMRPHLGFDIRDASSYPRGVDQVKEDVGFSRYWGAIVVYPNCTSTWTSSLQNGNASYDPTGCMGVFYSGARFYQITLLYLAPFMARFAGKVAQQASTQAVTTYLNNNAGNAAALATAANSPQAFATPFSFFNEDVKPINQWAAAAPFEAALIYYIIISFQIAVWGNAARQKTGWNKKLHYHWLVIFRLAVPMIDYIWISLNFTLLFKAFLIPNDVSFGNVGGFFALWSLNYLALCALGLALEVMISVLTAEFAPFFLIIWIILNLTSSFQPIELMEKFYRFLYWTPFLNTIEGYKIISYGTREPHQIGLRYGVLIAIIAVHIIAMCLAVALERWRDERQERKQLEQKNAKNEKQ